MPTFIPDTVDGSSLTYQPRVFGGTTKIRGGIVTDLTGDPSTILEQCMYASGMPQMGIATLVGGVNVVFNKLQVDAISADTARVQLIYESFQAAPVAYIVSSRTYLTSYTRNTIPGSRIPIRPPDWYENNGQPTAGGPSLHGTIQVPANKIPSDNCSMTFLRPIREVSVKGMRYGKPKDGQYEQNVGQVNDAPWRGLDIGYWVISDGGTDLSKFQGFYNFHISAQTQNNEDWSQVAILKNTLTGRFIKDEANNLPKLLAFPYRYGIIGGAPGLIRIGPYETVDFGSVYPFRTQYQPLFDTSVNQLGGGIV